MSDWTKFMFMVAAGLLVVAAALALERIAFLAGAERVVGQVSQVTAKDDRCRTRRSRYGRSRYNCTVFKALVEYRIDGGPPRSMILSAGEKRGHGQPVSAARHPPGTSVRLVYDPRNPQRIYRDSKGDVFGGSLFTLLLAVGAGVGGLKQPGKKA